MKPLLLLLLVAFVKAQEDPNFIRRPTVIRLNSDRFERFRARPSAISSISAVDATPPRAIGVPNRPPPATQPPPPRPAPPPQPNPAINVNPVVSQPQPQPQPQPQLQIPPQLAEILGLNQLGIPGVGGGAPPRPPVIASGLPQGVQLPEGINLPPGFQIPPGLLGASQAGVGGLTAASFNGAGQGGLVGGNFGAQPNLPQPGFGQPGGQTPAEAGLLGLFSSFAKQLTQNCKWQLF